MSDAVIMRTNRNAKARRPRRIEEVQGSIRDRHASPALRSLPAEALQIAPLAGARALIYNRLWRPIADGRMKAGAKLNEAELEKVFGVSRTVLKGILGHMATEGYVATPLHRSAYVLTPSPQEALAVFEALELVMVHIVGALSSRTLSAKQRKLLDLPLGAQSRADEAGDPIVAHLLGIEFLILLAALHGATLFTDLVARAVVLQTLSLKAYGRFPPPPWYIAFQRALVDALQSGDGASAVAEFTRRHAFIRDTLRFHAVDDYEEPDLTKLLTEEGGS